MRQSLIILGVVLGTLLCLLLYCTVLIDWVQDYQSGVYSNNHTEALLETAAILVYSYAGFDFFKRRLAQ